MADKNNPSLSESDRLFQEKGSTHDFNLSDSERALQPASPLQETTKHEVSGGSTKHNSSGGSKRISGRVDESKRITQTQPRVTAQKSHKK